MEDEVVVEPIGPRPSRKGRYSDTFFRHKIVVLAPLIICMIAGLGLAAKPHKTYASSMSLWADTQSPAASTIQTPSNNGTSSANMQQVLSELLGTQPFLATVAKNLGLPADTNLGGLRKGITVTAPGPQLLTVTAKEADPQTAVAVVKGVSNAFVTTVGTLMGARQQADLADAKAELQAAQSNLDTIAAQAAAYQKANPTGDQNAQFGEERDVAAAAVTTAQNTYSQLEAAQQTSPGAGLISPYGPASPAVTVASKKALIFAAGGGILAGLLLSVAVLCVLVGADRSVRRQADIEDLLALPVIGSIDSIPKRRMLGRGNAA